MIGISSINNIARSKKQKQFLIVFCFFALFLFLPDSFILAADSGLSWMQRLMLNIAFSVGGMFVFIGGFALDSAINVFVLNMGAMMNGNVGYVVNAVWVIIRDVFNLLFIFALIFIGLKLIWSADDSSSKRALGSLVIAALLINFSLFFAKFIVDFTNIAAIAVNDLITHVVSAEVSETGSDEDSTILFGSVTLYGIGGNLMQLMNLQNFGTENAIRKTETAGSIGYSIMVMIFLIFAGLVMLAGALMITIRFGLLVLYMMFSPFMFLGWILPQLAGQTRKWWDGFLKQAFYAPAYLFMVYIAFRVLAGYHAQSFKSGQENSLAAVLTNDGTQTGASAAQALNTSGPTLSLMFYFISLLFMILAIIVGQKIGIAGSNTSMNMIHGARKRIQGVAGRNTVGRGSQALGWGNEQLEKSRTGRNFKRALSTVSLGAFDERARQNLANKGKNAKFGSSYSLADNKKFMDDHITNRNNLVAQKNAETDFKDGLKAMEADTSTMNPAQLAAHNEKLQKMRSAITGMTTKQIEKLIKGQDGIIGDISEFFGKNNKQFDQMVAELTSTQVSGLLKSDNLDDKVKGEIVRARKESIQKLVTQVGNANNVLTNELRKLSGEQIETLGAGFVGTNIADFSDDQFKNHILKSKEFTDSQKQQFKASRKKTQIDRVGSSDITVQQKPFIKTKAGQNGFTEVEVKKPKEIAELPLDVLTHNSAQTHLTVPVLKEIAKNDNWSADDKAKLKQYIKNNGAIMNQEFDDYFKTSKAIDEFGN